MQLPFPHNHNHNHNHRTGMASNELRHGVTAEAMKSSGGGKRRVTAKRGLKSLALALSLPLSLYALSASIASSRDTRPMSLWWALHVTSPASSLLMGLAAWMVWADGGFHTNPRALLLYFTQLLLALLWPPILFAAGATLLAFILSLALFLAQLACFRAFRPVNPIAALFVKPSLASVAFLSILNLKLLFL
ncbi:hypothetical protein Fmac_006691 [Flemingia macrophylla]|uniref:Translocator protein homolog n=1 Tax=Flemingia macrophylla TaxID=520843 RepID=A0ABD1NBW0_9FABA